MERSSGPTAPDGLAPAAGGRAVAVSPADGRLLDEAVRRLVSALRPDRVYLYGSRARGDAHEDSDFDLMVVVPYAVTHSYVLEQQALAALWPLALPVDVVVMDSQRFEAQRPVAASLPATVVREGQLLYGG